MASITLDDLTDEIVSPTQGAGVFDVLMEKVETRIQEQYDAGRIKGSEFATVYVQALDSVLGKAVQFVLEKDKRAAEAMIAEATVEKQWGYDVTTVAGDLVMGASTGNGMVDQQIAEATEKVDLATGQVAKVYADIALVAQQQTTELAQTTTPTGGLTFAKYELINAQSLGFASDTKHKLLKSMYEGFAVELSLAAGGTIPESAKSISIDAVVQEILGDVGSTVILTTPPP